jgi:hypothetical protein
VESERDVGEMGEQVLGTWAAEGGNHRAVTLHARFKSHGAGSLVNAIILAGST